MSVTALPTPERERHESTIQILEDILARAKAGEIAEIAIAALTNDGSFFTYVPAQSGARLLGPVCYLQHLINTNIAISEIPPLPPAGDGDEKTS